MIISNVESLRTWLVDALQPICDADPSTLAKYVLALVKKDKPVEELKDLCVDQLAVFLGEETLPFVSTLFDALENQSYLQNEKPLMSQKSEDVIPDDDRDFRRRGKPDDEEDEVKHESIRDSRQSSQSINRFDSNRRKQVVDNRAGGRRKHHHDHSTRETDVKHVESEDEQESDLQDRHLQIEKPTRGSSPHRRSPIRHISPPGHRRRYNHKQPVKIERGDHRRSRREETDYRPSRHKPGSRSREEGKQILHELAKENMMNGPMMHFNPLPGLPPPFPLPPDHHLPLFNGGMIPFSKGMNVPMSQGPHTSQTNSMTMVPGQPHPIPTSFEVNQRFPFFPMPPRPLPPGMMWNNHRGKFPGPVEPYNPEFPSIEVPIMSMTGIPRNRPPGEINRERELVQLTQSSIPATTAMSADQDSSPKESNQENASTIEERIPVSSASDHSEPLSAPEPPRKPFQNQTILELKKIPEHFNDIMTLGQYFQRFGKVVNIKVRHDSDPQAALVEFASNSEARLAYSCPDAVLGNRFIKMFWHTVSQNKQRDNSANKGGAVGHSRKTFPKEMTYINPDMSAADKNRSHDESAHNQDKDSSQVDSLNREKEAKMQEITKQKIELQKQRQLLLEKNIKEQKRVIDLLSSKKQMSAQDKQTVFKTLKLLEMKGEKLKLEIEKVAKEVQANPLAKKNLHREILDGELEILNQKHSGLDTTTLKRKLDELKKKALSFGILGSARGRGRGRGRGAGTWQRSKQNSSTSLDNRSRQFFVWGFDDGEKDNLLARCEIHGKLERADEKLPGKLLISFETRKQAEAAAKDLASFYGKKLTLAWYEGIVTKRDSSIDISQHAVPPAKLRRRLSTSSDISMISLLGEEDKLLEFDENEKLLFADEDDDVSRDSDNQWKR